MNRRVFIIVLVFLVVVVMTYVADILSICLYVRHDSYRDFISLFSLMFTLPFHGANANVILPVIGQSYLYSGLGTLGWLYFMSRKTKDRLKDTEHPRAKIRTAVHRGRYTARDPILTNRVSCCVES